MKSFILLPIFLLCVQCVSCNERILSKFHQHSYKLRDVRAELLSYNEEFVRFCEVKTFKFNRTTAAINMTFIMKVDMKDKIEIIVQGNKFLSNEYRHFPLRFQVNLKKCYDQNIMGLANSNKCGNFKHFYIYKDVVYHCCNFVIDESHLPPLIPSGRYKTEITYLYLNEEVMVTAIFAEVYTPMVYPKN